MNRVRSPHAPRGFVRTSRKITYFVIASNGLRRTTFRGLPAPATLKVPVAGDEDSGDAAIPGLTGPRPH